MAFQIVTFIGNKQANNQTNKQIKYQVHGYIFDYLNEKTYILRIFPG